MQRVHYKHGDTPLVQTTRVPDADAHCLACQCLVPSVRGADRITHPIGHGCVCFSQSRP